MEVPLIPDLSNPKWLIIQQIHKVILAIDAFTFEVLGFEIFEGSPNDAKLLEKFIRKLCNSRTVRMGDFIMCDRGFTSMKNYHILISGFLLVPMIFEGKIRMCREYYPHLLLRLAFGTVKNIC
jgi:hypothetical protein